MEKMIKLDRLEASKCSITHMGTKIFQSIKLSSISFLDLGLNDIGNKGVKNLRNMPYLKILKLASCSISKEGVEYLAKYNSTVEQLYLSNIQN